jgi:hypothetical protein
MVIGSKPGPFAQIPAFALCATAGKRALFAVKMSSQAKPIRGRMGTQAMTIRRAIFAATLLSVGGAAWLLRAESGPSDPNLPPIPSWFAPRLTAPSPTPYAFVSTPAPTPSPDPDSSRWVPSDDHFSAFGPRRARVSGSSMLKKVGDPKEVTIIKPGSPPVTYDDYEEKDYETEDKTIAYPLIEEAYRQVYRQLFGIELTTPTPASSPGPTAEPTTEPSAGPTGAPTAPPVDTPSPIETPTPSPSPSPVPSPFDLVAVLNGASPMWSVYADQNRIYGASGNGSISIWDRSGLSFNTTVFPPGSPQDMYSTASFDRLFVGGNRNGSTYVWSWDLNDQLSFKTTLAPSGGIIFSVFADSDYIYAASEDQNIYVWDAASFSLQTILANGTDQMASVYADSQFIYGASANSYIYVWNRNNLGFNTAWTSSSLVMSSVTADSQYIYGGSEDRNIYVWNRSDFSPKTPLTGATNDIESVASDERAYVYGASFDSEVYVWSPQSSSFSEFTLPEWTSVTTPMHSVFADRYLPGDGITHYIFGANDDGNIYVWLAERTPTPTPEATATPSPVGFRTPTPSPSPSPTPEGFKTPTPSPLPTSSPSPTQIPSPSPTSSPITPTPTPIPAASPAPTAINRLLDPEFDEWSSQSETYYWVVKYQGAPGTWSQTTYAWTADYAGDFYNSDSVPAWVYQTGLSVESAATYHGSFYVKGWGTARVGINDSGGWSYSSPTIFNDSGWTLVEYSKASSYTSSTASLALEVTNCSGGPLTVDSAWFSDEERPEPGPFSPARSRREAFDLLAKLSGGEGWMFSVAADSTSIYGASEDKSIYVWDRSTRSLQAALTGPSDAVLSVYADPSPSGYVYGASRDNRIYIWEKTGWTLKMSLGIGRWPIESVWADADYIYGASSDHYIYVWNRSDFSFKTKLAQPEKRPGPGGIMISVTGDAAHVYGGSGDFDDTLYVWKRADFSVLTVFKAGADDLNSISSFNGSLYVANADGTIRVYDAASLAPVKVLSQSTGGMTSVAPASDYLYAGNSNGSVYAWERRGYSLLTRLRAGEQGVLWVWADDELILASSQDGSVYVWQAPATLKELRSSGLPGPTPFGGRPRFAPTPSGRGGSTVDRDDFSSRQPTPFHWDYKPTPMPFDPAKKTIDYPLLDDTYKKIYKDLFGIILTTPTPPPTPIATRTPEAVPTGSPGGTPTGGAVVINEINWFGTQAAVDGEWIELYNSGSSAVDLDGWKIVNSTQGWTAPIGSGVSISSGGYLVIARRPDITNLAEYLYDNYNFGVTGDSVSLLDDAGTPKDTVNCSNGWFAGLTLGVSMERINASVSGDSSSNWSDALPTATYSGDNRGTPRAKNSVTSSEAASSFSSASGVTGVATQNLKLLDYAEWIDFETGNYFKLFEWDLSKYPKSAAQFDYLPNSAFLFLATGFRPSAEYFCKNLLALVRDNGLDWAGEETCRYIADVAEAYAAMRAAGFFTRLERREIEDAFVKLALKARETYNYGNFAQGIVCGLNAAVGYIVGGKQGKEMIAWSSQLLSYDDTWTLPEDSRHYQGLFLRETLRVALYSNGMNIPDKDEEGKAWKDNFIRQINWIIDTFPGNGFCPSYGRDYRQNYIDHYMMPLIVATTVLDDGDPAHQRLAREAKWLMEKMFYYGTHHTVGPYGQNTKGYEAVQWGPFAILLNPIYLWWYLNEDIEPLAPDASLHGSQVVYRDRMPEGAIASVYDASVKQLKTQMDKIVHRSGWAEDALFALIDPAYPAAKNGDNKHNLAGNLLSLSYGPEEFLTGLTLSFWNGEKKRVNVADILDDYTGATLASWEDNEKFSRSVTKLKDKRGSWTREVTLYKTEDIRLEVKDTLSKGGSVWWHLQGTPQWGTNEVALDVNGTQLKVSWEGAEDATHRDVDSWSEKDPLQRWCYSGNPDRELKLSRPVAGTIITIFRGVKITPPAPQPSASPSAVEDEIPGM